ncbi:hypothetical protein [Kitasatospora sp. LaBMicrA B282]|uniref:hypothetical protein n=1 Tax=Kitasatospora sp. LaBMicrA B282 TaxID=3420949 RepID=UPI003D0D61FE
MTEHLHALRSLTATVLTTAVTTALTTDDRFATAYQAAQTAASANVSVPGHRELLRREAVFRLADAAHLAPCGLLTLNLAQGLDNRDRAWPRPVRRSALLTALAHLPAPAADVPANQAGRLPQGHAPATPRLAHLLHGAARRAAILLRTTAPEVRTLHRALAMAAQHEAGGLPGGYELLLERELTLRIALSLALPVTGALAPGLDLTLARATGTATRTDLADLILIAVRPNPARPAVLAVIDGHIDRVPPQRRRTAGCSCACATGGFCRGCGHSGCGRR